MDKTEFCLAEYDETIRMVLDSGGEFRIYPKGTSMLPLIRAGRDSVVLVKPEGELRRGDIAFYLRDNGKYVLHRAVCADNGRYIMCGDNQLTLEHGIESRHLIGVAKCLSRGDKRVELHSFGYRLYSLIWRSFFIRRVFFLLRRLKGGSKYQ